MLKLNLLEDEVLCGLLDKFISAMLPHEKYSSELSLEVLVTLEKYVELNEMNMEYYVIVSAIKELSKIHASKKGFKVILTRDVFDDILTQDIGDLVRNKDIGIVDWLNSNGLPSELEIETTYEMACQKLYERSINLYERCYCLQQETETVLNLIPALKSAYIRHTAEILIKHQAMILNSSLKEGWKNLTGSNDWLRYTLDKLSALKSKLDDSNDSVITIKSIMDAKALTKKFQKSLKPLTKWGIPPIDEALPICRNRLIVLAANEGIGKTTVAVNIIGNLIRDGGKFLFLTGENDPGTVWAKLLSNYIFQEFGVYITPSHIADEENLPEDKLKLIHIAEASLSNSAVNIVRFFNYKTFYTELVSAYEKEPYDMVIIDHSLTMKGEGTEYEKVSALALALRDFRMDYPVCCIVLSHLSSLAKEAIAKGKPVSNSPTKASANLSGEADEIFVLFQNETLLKQGLLGLQQYKRRDANPLTDYVILKKKFSVSAYEWDKTLQNNYGEEAIAIEDAVNTLNSIYDDSDYEDLDEDDDDFDYDYDYDLED